MTLILNHDEWYTLLIIDIIDWNDLEKLVNTSENHVLIFEISFSELYYGTISMMLL